MPTSADMDLEYPTCDSRPKHMHFQGTARIRCKLWQSSACRRTRFFSLFLRITYSVTSFLLFSVFFPVSPFENVLFINSTLLEFNFLSAASFYYVAFCSMLRYRLYSYAAFLYITMLHVFSANL